MMTNFLIPTPFMVCVAGPPGDSLSRAGPFIQREASEGPLRSEPTGVLLLFNADNLYDASRRIHSDPVAIVRRRTHSRQERKEHGVQRCLNIVREGALQEPMLSQY